MTLVIFRKYGNGNLIAIFPYEIADTDPGFCMSYSHVGQHGGCDPMHIMRKTSPATISESAKLSNELKHKVGYRDLKVLNILPKDHGRQRILSYWKTG